MVYTLALTRRKRFQTVLFVGREQLPLFHARQNASKLDIAPSRNPLLGVKARVVSLVIAPERVGAFTTAGVDDRRCE